MRKEIAERWVARLKSGEIKQCRGALRIGEARCCLGVLCDLAAEDNPDMNWGEAVSLEGGYDDASCRARNPGCMSFGSSSDAFRRNTVLPHSVVEWAGMLSAAGDFAFDYATPRLVSLHDRGTPFSVIADVISKNAERL